MFLALIQWILFYKVTVQLMGMANTLKDSRRLSNYVKKDVFTTFSNYYKITPPVILSTIWWSTIVRKNIFKFIDVPISIHPLFLGPGVHYWILKGFIPLEHMWPQEEVSPAARLREAENSAWTLSLSVIWSYSQPKYSFSRVSASSREGYIFVLNAPVICNDWA